MSVRMPPGSGRRDDDELLDRLGRGEPVDGGEVERLLYHWRSSLPTASATDDRLLDAVTTAIARPTTGHGRLRKVTAGAAVAALLAAGGVTAAASQAGPDSPLWPVTELVFGGVAESRAAVARADGALRDARTAADEGRIPEATRLLAHADQLADKVDEPTAADRIRDDVAAIRERLGLQAAKAPPGTETPNGPLSEPPTAPRSTTPTTDPAPYRPDPTGAAPEPPTHDRSFDDDPAGDKPPRAKQSTDTRPGPVDGRDDRRDGDRSEDSGEDSEWPNR